MSLRALPAFEVVLDPAGKLLDASGGAGADLDLGFNDFVDATIVVAATHRGNLEMRYQCDDSDTVVASIPESILRKDGRPHVYRLDMGAELPWRGRLKSVSIEGATAISVGDGEGTDYLTLPLDEEWKDMKQAESKHFRIVWGKELSKDFTAERAHGTLRNFEEAWQVLVKVMKLKKPYPIEGAPGEYRKVNVVTHRAGYESGGGTVSMDPSGLRVDPPSWVIPHELMHVFQEVQGGKMAGMWCENHADYAIERWLRHVRLLFAGTDDVASGEPTCFNPSFATMAHWYPAHGRDYYLCWPIWTYLDENPDALPGLGGGSVSSRLWQGIRANEDVFSAVHRLTGVDVSTMIGHYARRNVTWNYANGGAMRRVYAEFLQNEPRQRTLIYADLVPRPDAPGWWQPEQLRALQPGGYTQHELKLPKNQRATVDLRPLGGPVRASLVALNEDGSEAAFVGPVASGAMSMDVPPSAKRLILVAAAVSEKWEYWTEDETLFPMRTHPMRQRHPYVVKLIGTEPLPSSSTMEGGHRHTNGGGFVADTAQVAPTAYVGPDAAILDEARIEDHAIIDGHATVTGKAVIRGEARVLGPALIENAVIGDQATVSGQCHVWRDEGAAISGDAVLAVDYGGGRPVSNGFQTGFVGWVACPLEWIDARTAPAHRWVNYEFAQAHDQVITDSPGFTDAFVIGKPGWKDGTILFDGKTQGVLLDRNVINLHRATISVRVKWAGGAAMQPVWSFGKADNTLTLTPDDGHGQAALLIRHDGKTTAITAGSALPKDRWFQLTVTLDEETQALYGDGRLIGEAHVKATAHDFAGERCFLASDLHHWFTGALDDFRVWSTLLTAKELQALTGR